MMVSPAPDAGGRLDEAQLTARYWLLFATASFVAILEFFDVFIVGFLVAVVGPQWKLTFLQAAAILLATGIGSIFGAGFGGYLADVRGRRTVMIVASLGTAIGSASIGLLPERAWLGFAALRFVVGFGQGALAAAMLPMLVEWTPLRWRTLLTSVQNVFTSVGILLASAVAATLLTVIGWRGVALLGAVPVMSAVLIWLFIPESPRWLMAHGRIEEASEAARKVFGFKPALTTDSKARPARTFAELFTFPDRVILIALGWAAFSTIQTSVLYWGPTMLAMKLGVSAAEAAGMFVAVSLAGVAGTLLLAVVANVVGRSTTCRWSFYMIAMLLVLAAFAGDHHFLGVSSFLVLLAVAEGLLGGVVANLSPYSAELWPAGLAGRGAGFAQMCNALGKIVGPVLLALVAGSGDYVTPKATAEAIIPTFWFLGGFAAIAALAFTMIRIETHRRRSPV